MSFETVERYGQKLLPRFTQAPEFLDSKYTLKSPTLYFKYALTSPKLSQMRMRSRASLNRQYLQCVQKKADILLFSGILPPLPPPPPLHHHRPACTRWRLGEGQGREGEGAASSRSGRRCRLDLALCIDLLGLSFTNPTLCYSNPYLSIYKKARPTRVIVNIVKQSLHSSSHRLHRHKKDFNVFWP